MPAAVGHLHFLWWWALSYAQDGNLADFEDDDVAFAAGWEAEPNQFVAALQKAGFLDGRQIHDWLDYAGRLIEKRRENAERMRKARARSSHVQRTLPARAGATVPNQTVPNQTVPNSTTTPPKSPSPPGAAAAAADAKVVERMTEIYEAEIETSSPAVLKAISRWLEVLPPGDEVELWQYAVEEAVKNGARRLNYIEGVLRGLEGRKWNVDDERPADDEADRLWDRYQRGKQPEPGLAQAVNE
jgi:hypothetical protein